MSRTNYINKVILWPYRKIALNYRKLRNRFYPTEKLWEKSQASEVEFWDEYIATQGLGKFQDKYKEKLDPTLPLQPEIANCLDTLESKAEGFTILDVGAGPFTPLGKVYKDQKLKIAAIDPLAREYDVILDKYNITPPVRTQFGVGEKLLDLFSAESFDITYSRNALDHSYDPLTVVKNMFSVAKKNGFVVLMHHKNEAEQEQYQGLHQWNFDEQDGKFVIWNQSSKYNVTEIFSSEAEVQCYYDGNWVVATIKKI